MFATTLLHNMIQLPALPLAGIWFGESATVNGEDVDALFAIINWIALAFFVLVVTLMIVFVAKYRKRPGHVEQPSPAHNNTLEIIWTIIPILLLALIFFLGFTGFVDMRTPPDNAYDIQVRASKWKFLFVYPNGAEVEELHVPPNQPVRLVQQSADVLHSLYIPAFRTKMDCVPRKYTFQWFEANKPGRYDLFCAEYCGKDHSNMNSVAIVYESQAEFDDALAKALKRPDDETPAQFGEFLYDRKGCKQCHSVDGSARAGGGPSWKGIWGKEETMAGGKKVKVDENYIIESIRQPQANIVNGYKGVNMTAYPESLVKQHEVDALIAYIKSLKDE